MNELDENNNLLSCNICFQEINITKKHECPTCKYVMCIDCFDKYTIQYHNNTCAHCRTHINITVPNTESYNGVLNRRSCKLKKCLYFLYFCLIIYLSYYIGLWISNIYDVSFIFINIVMGLMVIGMIVILFFIFLTLCCSD